MLKTIAKQLPEPLLGWARAAYHAASSLSPEQRERDAWMREQYHKFAMDQRESIFLGIARFCHINRPSPGYYFEFGSHEANTMRMAWKHSRFLFDWTFVAFDSFQGLPEIQKIDEQAIWAKGRLKTAEQEFVNIVTGAGMPRERLVTVPGFYDQSLTPELAARLDKGKAAVVYVDCDLYASTVPVLKFVRGFLRPGTVIVFDDWFCFHGDPEKGEQRAWSEFLAEHPDLRFAPFMQTSEAKAFICLSS